LALTLVPLFWLVGPEQKVLDNIMIPYGTDTNRQTKGRSSRQDS